MISKVGNCHDPNKGYEDLEGYLTSLRREVQYGTSAAYSRKASAALVKRSEIDLVLLRPLAMLCSNS